MSDLVLARPVADHVARPCACDARDAATCFSADAPIESSVDFVALDFVKKSRVVEHGPHEQVHFASATSLVASTALGVGLGLRTRSVQARIMSRMTVSIFRLFSIAQS